MPTVKEDLIEGSVVETDGLIRRAVRVFHVDGIVVNPDQPYETLWQAQTTPGIPQYNSKHPSRSELILRAIQVVGTSGTSAKMLLRYESPEWGGPPSSSIITDDGYIEKYQTTYIPGTRRLITVSAEVTVNVPVDIGGGISSEQQQTEHIGDEPVPFVFDRNIRVISVHSLVYGSLQQGVGFDGPYSGNKPQVGQRLAGRVNDAPWMDLPKGYWKLQRFRTSMSRYSGYYTKEIIAATKNDEDWSEFGILRSKMTGNFIKPDEKALAAVAEMPYEFGIIGEQQSNKKGFRRVGPAQLTNFPALFGF